MKTPYSCARDLAKRFVFRILYGGSEFSFAKDPDFAKAYASPSRGGAWGLGPEEFWKRTIATFYTKYSGLKAWHDGLVEQIKRAPVLVMETGKTYVFKPLIKNGTLSYPRTQILNYPVQGLGADIVMLARIDILKKILRDKLSTTVLPISTVHDSIIFDVPSKKVDQVVKMIFDT